MTVQMQIERLGYKIQQDTPLYATYEKSYDMCNISLTYTKGTGQICLVCGIDRIKSVVMLKDWANALWLTKFDKLLSSK